ncbi:hypothetical protein HOY82DRAFT_155648 [Tuber indicum]|nr:hypothetical protein HOY82DRAFT_155648 [Tuber indicum]
MILFLPSLSFPLLSPFLSLSLNLSPPLPHPNRLYPTAPSVYHISTCFIRSCLPSLLTQYCKRSTHKLQRINSRPPHSLPPPQKGKKERTRRKKKERRRKKKKGANSKHWQQRLTKIPVPCSSRMRSDTVCRCMHASERTSRYQQLLPFLARARK